MGDLVDWVLEAGAAEPPPAAATLVLPPLDEVLHDHHVLYRSRGGDNTRDNRVAICAAHHLNGIHRFRIRVSGVAAHDLTWEIGFRRGRPPLLHTHGDRYLEVRP